MVVPGEVRWLRFVLTLLFVLASTPLWPQSETSKAADPPSAERTSPPPGAQAQLPAPGAGITPTSPGDSTQLEPLKIQQAVYPDEAAQKGIQGQVWVKLLISETGDVENVEVVSGDPILAKAAVDAAKKWKFKPFIKNGKPVKVSTKMPLNFAFRDKVTDARPPAAPTPTSSNDATAPQRVRIAQGVSQGLLIHKVQPIYPEAARRNRIQGIVLLQAVIGRDGRVQDLTLVSGPKELAGAAIGAVQQWCYKPYMLNNEPVEMLTLITVNFQIRPF